MEEALNRLAEAVGIEPRYWDIAGRLHETSPETARRLLAAMGFSAATPEEIAASLARLDAESWGEKLPPAIVAAEGREILVPLRLPAGRLRWTLEREDGQRLQGEIAPDELAIEAAGACDGIPVFLRRLALPAQPCGYHRLLVEADGEYAAPVIVAPARCHLPPGGRLWGVAAQLYSLRSAQDGGMGDFTDLRALMEWAGAAGASAVGINPLHALFLDAPEDGSPYSPCSRLFLNPLYLDVTATPDFAEIAETRDAASAGDFVDYKKVAASRLGVFERLHAHFRAVHADDARGRAFREFVAGAGPGLRRFAQFQVLCERYASHDWTRWPQDAQNPDAGLSPRDAERAHFFQYLQWQCALQLADAAGAAKGMAIGLYNDLAVSVDAASADRWADRALFLGEVRVGAPPDPFNEKGQDWGLVPFDPRALRASGYAHFIALLRANMRHAGALRIDHVMGWQRLFLVPAGSPATEGAYLRFPLEDLIAIAALESRRNACMVIGEDLGTVPAGFRERMAAADILSYRILYFERDGARFRRPGELPACAAVSVATHDLATLRGYWTGEDIAAKARLGVFTQEEERRQREERARDRHLLLEALAAEGLHAAAADAPWSPALGQVIHAYLARSPALLFMVQLDDLAGEAQQANLPGSVREYPNWRRRLGRSLADIAADPAVAATIARIAQERGH